jgi:carbon monoxide dehydrogenase subunit G
MRLSSKQDIEAPLAFVFNALEDFDGWERAALRRGADVSRTDALRQVAPGMAWSVKFAFRGKDRDLALKLTEVDRPTRLGFSGTGSSMEGVAALDMLELGARRTRMTLTMEILPRTLAARLLLQSLKLAGGKLAKRLDQRMAQLAADIEDRFKRQPRR